MSTVKTDAITAVSAGGDLSLDGLGTGGVSIASTLKMTKGGDISSASPLVIDTDGNYFDVTGTTNFAAMTVESGNFFMLQFDGALTITHGSGIELPGAANLTTATGDRLICYATASNTVEVMSVATEAAAAAGGWSFVEKVVASGSSSLVFGEGNLDAGYDYFILCRDVQMSGDSTVAQSIHLQFGTGGTPTYQTSTYTGLSVRHGSNGPEDTEDDVTAGCVIAGYGNLGGASGELWSAEVLISDPAANTKSKVRSFWNGFGNVANDCNGYATFNRTTADIATGLKILPGTGTITTGDFILARRTTA